MRILLAEDERELSNALVMILKHNNYSVDAVYNGADAVDYLESGIYDGAVMDIMMPEKDGITALKEIRAAGNRTPVILLTAKSEIDDRVFGLDSGADDYLTKPFSTKELLARIRAITRRQGEPSDSVLRCGNITLNRRSYELASPHGAFCLANKEYQMLEMLMSNSGRIISAEQFMEKIWGWDSESEINVVWVYISYLRKKLSAIGANVKITARRNLGYILEECND